MGRASNLHVGPTGASLAIALLWFSLLMWPDSHLCRLLAFPTFPRDVVHAPSAIAADHRVSDEFLAIWGRCFGGTALERSP